MPKNSEQPFALVDRMDLMPICPYCEEELAEVYCKGAGFARGQAPHVDLLLPELPQALGFAQRRMF